MEEAAPRKPNRRSIRRVRSPGPDGIGIYCITINQEDAYYGVLEIPCMIGGRGFEILRHGREIIYHVRVGLPEECTCECKGFLVRNQCRHVQILKTLVRQGIL